MRFEPCPGLTAAGRGVVSPENIAFTRWLTHLQNGVLLDEQNCLMLPPWCRPESDVIAELSRRFSCTLEHWYAEQGCDFCGWQLYERGELVDVLWGELEWSSPTDDDELPEVTGPAWIVANVAHYGG